MTREANQNEIDFSPVIDSNGGDGLWQSSVASSTWSKDTLQLEDSRSSLSLPSEFGDCNKMQVSLRMVNETVADFSSSFEKLFKEQQEGKDVDWTGFRKDLTEAVQGAYASKGRVGATQLINDINDGIKGPYGLAETHDSRMNRRDMVVEFVDQTTGTSERIGKLLQIEAYPGQAAVAEKLAKIISENKGFGGPEQQEEIRKALESERDGGSSAIGAFCRVGSLIERINDSLKGMTLQGGLGLGGASLYLREGTQTGPVADSFRTGLPPKTYKDGEVLRSTRS